MVITWLILLICLSVQTTYPAVPQPTLCCNHHKDNTYTLSVMLPIIAPQIVYRDYVTLNIDHPEVTLSPWKATPESVTIFDKHFKKDKHAFTQSVIITCQAHVSHPVVPPVHLHLSYVTGPRIQVHHKILPCALDYGARIDSSQAEPTNTPQSPITSASHNDAINDTTQLSSPDAPTPATDCAGPGCMIMGIIVLLAGLLLLNQANQEHSESSLHGGIIIIIIAVLIMVHGHHALQINTHNPTTQNQTHCIDPMNVYQP